LSQKYEMYKNAKLEVDSITRSIKKSVRSYSISHMER